MFVVIFVLMDRIVTLAIGQKLHRSLAKSPLFDQAHPRQLFHELNYLVTSPRNRRFGIGEVGAFCSCLGSQQVISHLLLGLKYGITVDSPEMLKVIHH